MLTKAQQLLKQYFGYDSFRPMQDEIIEKVVNKKDCLVLMPTGGGKSICFQIPALISSGVGIVVSPLIALMKDQVEGLKANGVPAAYLNSSQTEVERSRVEEGVKSGEIKLLYVSPEKLLSEDFYYLLKEISLSLFAIDEAHCISSWGHDFRAEYTKLAILKRQFPDVPIIALTATADKITRRDIVKQLNLTSPKIFISSFDRPNISLKVLPGQKRIDYIRNFIIDRPKMSGIIYCLSRKNTESVAEKLKASGINAAYYHAGMNSDERSRVQEEFTNDNIMVICATVAFGMGIDKSNIRWVIHYSLPKNIEGYYQEIGRSGRDGLKSEAVLFYSYGDVITLQGFAESSGQRELQIAKLERMQQYADAHICRRKILLNYFNENLAEDCGNCDVCKNPPQQFDGTIIAQKALSAIYRVKEAVATGTLIDILRGSLNQKIVQGGFNKIKTFATGNEISHAGWQQYLMQMLNMGLFEIAYDQNNILKLTPQSNEVLFENKKISLVRMSDIKEREKQQKAKAKAKKVPKNIQVNNDLFEILRTLRKKIASEKSIPPYVVFHDTTLKEMSSGKPLSKDEMMNIQGMGEKKFEQYGEIFINEIKNFVKTQSKSIKGSTYDITHNMYNKGMSIEQIATERKLGYGTIISHIAHLHETGAVIDVSKFISKNEMDKILNAIKEVGSIEKLKPLFDFMKEEIEYDKIRIGLAHYKSTKIN